MIIWVYLHPKYKCSINFHKFSLAKNVTLGRWMDATDCESNNIDASGAQCGSGTKDQTQICWDGVEQKCDSNLKRNSIQCRLKDCPPSKYIFNH